MLRTRLAAPALFALLLLAACSGRSSGDDGSDDTLGVEVVFDATIGDDPGATPDASPDLSDGLSDVASAESEALAESEAADVPPSDTGTEVEATPPVDAEPDDLAAEPDHAEVLVDAEPTDPGTPESTDVANDPSTDTDPGPVGDNVLAEGSFEAWADGLPIGWVGSATNLSADAIAEETGVAHDGVRSCRLTNPADGHKRFSTAPLALQAGKYSCRYWVRGQGEIRNGRYDGDYSSYSAYTTVAGDAWEHVDYAFNVAADTSALELIFSVRLTAEAGLVLDDVRCVRAPQACDTVVCEAWQVCEGPDGACVTAPGKCADAGDCAPWQVCGADHACELATGACASTADCSGEIPVCDLDTHLCVAGDPCAAATCQEWQSCQPSDATCVTAPGRCVALADCDQALPACDLATHTCVAVDAPINVVPNGGFEDWSTVILGAATESLLPDHWYGICDGCSPYFPTTEIDANHVKPYTTAPHTGATALQLVEPSTPADRFASEPFAVTPGVTYACTYRVRGHGTYRQRGYCGAWNPDTDYQAIDSDQWQQVPFTLGGNASWCVLILYASNTVADRDHLQFDDVVCMAP